MMVARSFCSIFLAHGPCLLLPGCETSATPSLSAISGKDFRRATNTPSATMGRNQTLSSPGSYLRGGFLTREAQRPAEDDLRLPDRTCLPRESSRRAKILHISFTVRLRRKPSAISYQPRQRSRADAASFSFTANPGILACLKDLRIASKTLAPDDARAARNACLQPVLFGALQDFLPVREGAPSWRFSSTNEET